MTEDPAARSDPPTEGIGEVRKSALAAGTIGNFVEWYDFAIYAYSAPVIATLFFPEGDRTAALLATFAIYGVAFVVRPLGSVIFGNMGDRAGRRNTLSLVVLLMGAATLLIGLLPTYGQVSVLAPVLLLVCRLTQGFSAGGEFAGSNSFIMEYAPTERRGFWASISSASTVFPSVVGATVVLLLTSTLSTGAYESWGWRVPFLIGGPLAIFGLYLRLRMEDTPAFRTLERTQSVDRVPALDAVRNYWKEMLYIFALSALQGLAFYMLSGYLVTYLIETIGLDPTTALLSNMVALGLLTVAIPLGGLLGDRIGRRPMMFAGCAIVAFLSLSAFLLAGSGTLGAAIAGQVMLALGIAFFAPGYTPAQAEIFPTRVRYSGNAISYNVAYAAFGGTAPLLSTYLVSRTGSNIAPAYYLVAVAVIVVFFVFAMPETYRLPLVREDERRPNEGARPGAVTGHPS